MYSATCWQQQAAAVSRVLSRAPEINRQLRVPQSEFARRHQAVTQMLARHDIKVGLVYSDEHFCGDVPYLGGNTNITIEPVAGLVGNSGFHLLAGLEGGFSVEELGYRSGAVIHKVGLLQLADEEYPVRAERLEDIVEDCAGCRPDRIALLTPKSVLPVSVYHALRDYLGGEEYLVDLHQEYARIKNRKSLIEMQLTQQASLISDVMLEAMLAVLRPGMLETQVAQWGYAVALELGVEEMGFDLMVTTGVNNRTMVGKALNVPIAHGEAVHIGVAPKCDGLTSCERVSAIALAPGEAMPQHHRFWLDLLQEGFQVGLDSYIEVAAKGLPACTQERALVDYFVSRQAEVERRYGKKIDMEQQKPYTGTHGGGYTECQEFFGAITQSTREPLDEQIVTMLDVAVKGMGSYWNEQVIPGVDFYIVEKTIGKFGTQARLLNQLPVEIQQLVGVGY